MDLTRARGLYLAAMGLTALVGCSGPETTNPQITAPTEPTVIPPPPTAVPTTMVPTATTVVPTTAVPTAATAVSTTTSAPTTETRVPKPAHPTATWEPVSRLRPPSPEERPRPTCPSEKFCIGPSATPGAAKAPAPYQTCDVKPAGPSGLGWWVNFDAESTAAHPGACCYQRVQLCPGGRALLGDAGPVTAPTTRRGDWLAEGPVTRGPPTLAERRALAAYWEREAAFEHASIASFARASLVLLANGAPPDLVLGTHAAALDEVEHARLTYALASTCGGTPRGPGLLAVPGGLATSLPELATETFLEGCAGEAAAALSLREAAAAAEDPAVRAVLERIAGDEERHAELAWRTVAWALEAGGAPVARALGAAMRLLEGELAVGAAPVSEAFDLSAHGALGDAARWTLRRRALAEVVLPCADALLAARTTGAAALDCAA